MEKKISHTRRVIIFQISPGNRAGGTSLITSASLNVKKEIIKQATRIPEWAFGEVFQLRDLCYGCRRIVRSLEEAEVFTTRSSVSRLLNGQPPYAGIELEV